MHSDPWHIVINIDASFAAIALGLSLSWFPASTRIKLRSNNGQV